MDRVAAALHPLAELFEPLRVLATHAGQLAVQQRALASKLPQLRTPRLLALGSASALPGLRRALPPRPRTLDTPPLDTLPRALL